MLTYLGVTKCAKLWAEEYGLKYGTLIGRIRLGWGIEEALTIKPIIAVADGLRKCCVLAVILGVLVS